MTVPASTAPQDQDGAAMAKQNNQAVSSGRRTTSWAGEDAVIVILW